VALARVFPLLALAGLLALRAPAPAAPAPPSEPKIQTTLNLLVRGLDGESAAQLSAAYAPDATIVDEFAPFSWRSPGAAARWLAGFEAYCASLKVTAPHIAGGAPRFVHEGTGVAYVALPLTFTFRADGHPQVEHGGLALTLRKLGAAWRISSSAWYKLDDSTEVPL
jgi:hypothetical protein